VIFKFLNVNSSFNVDMTDRILEGTRQRTSVALVSNLQNYM